LGQAFNFKLGCGVVVSADVESNSYHRKLNIKVLRSVTQLLKGITSSCFKAEISQRLNSETKAVGIKQRFIQFFMRITKYGQLFVYLFFIKGYSKKSTFRLSDFYFNIPPMWSQHFDDNILTWLCHYLFTFSIPMHQVFLAEIIVYT
jgi:hypothetical protein